MSDEQPEPLFKRLWVAQPKKLMRYARFTVREIHNSNITQDNCVMRPARKWGWNDRDFEMYHHQSTVDLLKAETVNLKAEIKMLRESMKQARSHCGWAQTQESAQDARNCAAKAAEVLDVLLNNKIEDVIVNALKNQGVSSENGQHSST